MLKRFITSLFCLILFLVSVPIFGLTEFFSVPVYADSVPDGYSPCGLNDQVDAFRSYCKSRNLSIEGSVADAVTSVTSETYQFLLDKVGLDVNEIQNELYKNTKDNGAAKWFFTTSGISAFNRMFAEFLQNNDLAVGDKDVNKVIQSGKYFQDDSGNACFLYSTNGTYNNIGSIVAIGTYYKYPYSTYKSALLNQSTPSNFTSVILEKTYNFTFTYRVDSAGGNYENYQLRTSVIQQGNGTAYNSMLAQQNKDGTFPKSSNNSYFCIAINNSGRLFLAKVNADNSSISPAFVLTSSGDYSSQYPSTTINIVSNEINNNTYEGDTYITNEGDVINNPAPGGKDPGWDVGGGQGSYDDGQGNNYTINFPDFELPDLNIDWSISGLGNKFPFSIPFDIVALVTVLNAEPEAPRFQGTVNFGFTTWDYDINLQQFDTVAQVCRIAELLLLVFGLILITRSIIKG